MRYPFSALVIGGLIVSASANQAMAWGATGHRIIGQLAILTLPKDVPEFLRRPATVEAVGELAREPDRWRGAGRVHDGERDPAHFVDLDDEGKVLGGPSFEQLPPTRQAYETALRAVGSDSWKAGYLPYAIIDGWQQLSKDLGYWRADAAAATSVADIGHRRWFVADQAQREALIIRDIGTLAHYVGDASQPMHVSIHYNGWGDLPNPAGFTQERVHVSFEGIYLKGATTLAAVQSAMPEPADCHCPIERRTADYLIVTNSQIIPYFKMQKSGGFAPNDPRGRTFVTARVAAGAAELRDLIALAWRDSHDAKVGWPAISVTDVETGKIDPFDSLYGED